MIYLPLLLINELNFRVRDLMVGAVSHTSFYYCVLTAMTLTLKSVHLSIRSKEISSSTDQLPLTVSYEGISLRGFRFWVHLQDVVYSLRQFGELIR